MIKFAPFAALAMLASFSLAPIVAQAEGTPIKVSEGKMIYGTDGHRLAPVYRVNADGSVELIMEGRLVTIPATILTDVNGKLTSSETKSDLLR